jgi:hypothetical protein
LPKPHEAPDIPFIKRLLDTPGPRAERAIVHEVVWGSRFLTRHALFPPEESFPDVAFVDNYVEMRTLPKEKVVVQSVLMVIRITLEGCDSAATE